MAANPSRSSDFFRNQSTEKITSYLIPPSEFEKPVTAGSRDVEKVQRLNQHFDVKDEHIRHLPNQLQNLNAAAACTHTKNDYADELIKRQAGEITELRSELLKCRLAYEQDAADWRKKLSLQEEEHEAEVKLLEKQLAREEEEFKEKLSFGQSEISSVKEKLESTQLFLNKRVQELEEQLKLMQQESDSSRRQLEAELRNKSQMVEDQTHQINRLKTYICEAEQAQRPAMAWKLENEAMDNKLKVSQAENHKLSSTLELLDVRFKALNEVLALQEKQLSHAKIGGAQRSKLASSLITSWREKVFSLLVQQKTAEILHRKDICNLQQKIQDLQEDLAESKSHIEVFQHSLTDRMAQIQIEVNHREKLEQELEQTHQVAVCLDEQSKRDNSSMRSLSSFAERIKNQADELMTVMEQKSNVLKMLAQRVNFASSRMDFIKTQFLRKSAFSFGVSKDMTVQALPVSQTVQHALSGSESLMCQELEKVTHERDSLAAQVRADSEKWSEILKETKSQHTAEVAALNRRIENLECQLQQKTKNCSQLTEEVEDLREDNKEKDNVISYLQAELDRHNRGVESVLADQKLKDQMEWNTKLADLEQKLNHSKREHAKAVVSLRQMEHSHKRKVQQDKDLLRSTEEHLTRQIQQLESRLRSVEKERNLMMATLRQEGLLGQLRTDRGKCVQFVDEEDTCGQNVPGSSHLVPETRQDASELGDVQKLNGSSTSATVEPSSAVDSRTHHETVQFVLEDLKSLSAAILDDDDDVNDDDIEDHNERISGDVSDISLP